MSWEQRGNGTYYYRKRREGGRVISEYVGTGQVAELAVQLDELNRDKVELERTEQRIKRAEVEALDKELGEVYTLIEMLTEAILESDGLHKHKGQWRRKRNEKANSTRDTAGVRACVGSSGAEARENAD